MAHIYASRDDAERMANYYCDKAARNYHTAELIEQSVRQRFLEILDGGQRLTDEKLDTIANDILILQEAREETKKLLKNANEARADQLAFEAEQTITAEEEAEA